MKNDLLLPVPHVEIANNNEVFMQNLNRNEMFPGGLICEVDGKKIPPFVTCSPHGGITSQILADMLKWIDMYYLQRTPSSPTPCLILDGHSSRFEIPFLSYVTNSEHKWYLLIGIPYVTSIWQFGDSVE